MKITRIFWQVNGTPKRGFWERMTEPEQLTALVHKGWRITGEPSPDYDFLHDKPKVKPTQVEVSSSQVTSAILNGLRTYLSTYSSHKYTKREAAVIVTACIGKALESVSEFRLSELQEQLLRIMPQQKPKQEPKQEPKTNEALGEYVNGMIATSQKTMEMETTNSQKMMQKGKLLAYRDITSKIVELQDA